LALLKKNKNLNEEMRLYKVVRKGGITSHLPHT